MKIIDKSKTTRNNVENQLNESFRFCGSRYEMIDIAIENKRWKSLPMIMEGLEAIDVAKFSAYWYQKTAATFGSIKL